MRLPRLFDSVLETNTVPLFETNTSAPLFEAREIHHAWPLLCASYESVFETRGSSEDCCARRTRPCSRGAREEVWRGSS